VSQDKNEKQTVSYPAYESLARNGVTLRVFCFDVAQ
jgi:hypothetical protein